MTTPLDELAERVKMRPCPAVHSTEGTCGEHLCGGRMKVLNTDDPVFQALWYQSCKKIGQRHWHFGRYFSPMQDCAQEYVRHPRAESAELLPDAIDTDINSYKTLVAGVKGWTVILHPLEHGQNSRGDAPHWLDALAAADLVQVKESHDPATD